MNREEIELFNQFKMYFSKKTGGFASFNINGFYSKLCQLCNLKPKDSHKTDLSLESYYKSETSRNYINNIIEIIVNKHGIDKIFETLVKFGLHDTTYIMAKIQNNFKLNKFFHALEAKKNELIDNAVSLKNPQKKQEVFTDLVMGYNFRLQPYEYLYVNILSHRFFNSSSHDLELNVNSLHDFYNKFNNTVPVILKDKFEFFEKLHADITSNSFSDETFNQLFNQLKNRDNMADLYDCLSFAKQIISKTLISSLTKKENMPSLQKPQGFDSKIPKDVRILDLRGKKFKLLVTTTQSARSGIDGEYDSTQNDVASFSLISNDCLHTFRSLLNKITFIYFNVDPKDIVHITECDNYTSYTRDKTSVSNVRFAMMTPDELIETAIKTRKYNEIDAHFPNALNDLEDNWSEEWKQTSFKRPQGIFCLNKITNTEIKIARENNLPIIYYEDKQYVWYGEVLPYPSFNEMYERC